MADLPSILCVGKSDFSQKTRCSLLESQGFEVTQSTPEHAPLLVARSTFDLIILAFDVTELAELQIRSAADTKTRIIKLPGFTYPAELLEMIRRAIGPRL